MAVHHRNSSARASQNLFQCLETAIPNWLPTCAAVKWSALPYNRNPVFATSGLAHGVKAWLGGKETVRTSRGFASLALRIRRVPLIPHL